MYEFISIYVLPRFCPCLWLLFFSKFGEFQPLFLWVFSSLFSLSWYSHYTYVVPHFSKALIIFLHFFPLCSSACIISIDLSSGLLILPSSISDLLLSPSSVFYFIYCAFQLLTLHVDLFHNFSFLIYSVWCDMVTPSFASFITLFFSLSIIFIWLLRRISLLTPTLVTLTGVSVVAFFLSVWVILACFLASLIVFGWKLYILYSKLPQTCVLVSPPHFGVCYYYVLLYLVTGWIILLLSGSPYTQYWASVVSPQECTALGMPKDTLVWQ